MIIRVMGFCAWINKQVALQALPYAQKYIDTKDGLIIASSADLFLGEIGVISKNDALIVFPFLEQSMENCFENEQDWILKALIKVIKNLDQDDQTKARKFAEQWQYSSRKSTQQRARKLLSLTRV